MADSWEQQANLAATAAARAPAAAPEGELQGGATTLERQMAPVHARISSDMLVSASPATDASPAESHDELPAGSGLGLAWRAQLAKRGAEVVSARAAVVVLSVYAAALGISEITFL